VISEFVPVLRAMGCESEVVSLDNPDLVDRDAMEAHIHALGPGGGGYRFSRNLVPWLRHNLAHYDASIVHGIWTYHSAGAFVAHRTVSTPYFLFPHGMLDPWFRRTYPFKHLKKWIYWNLIERRVVRSARAVIFTCEQERRLARNSFPNYACRERVNTLGTTAMSEEACGKGNAFLEEFPFLRQRRFVLFLSRLHPKKGVDLLIRAYARVRDLANFGASGFSMVIAGPPVSEAYLQQMKDLAAELNIPIVGQERIGSKSSNHSETGDAIAFAPMLTGNVKTGAYRACEALVLPSHQENFGMVVAEALSHGRPVLISDQVNIWREVAAAEAGIVEPDTIEGTERLLVRWFRMQGEQREAMGRQALACFHQKFEIKKAAGMLKDTISQLLSPDDVNTLAAESR